MEGVCVKYRIFSRVVFRLTYRKLKTFKMLIFWHEYEITIIFIRKLFHFSTIILEKNYFSKRFFHYSLSLLTIKNSETH